MELRRIMHVCLTGTEWDSETDQCRSRYLPTIGNRDPQWDKLGQPARSKGSEDFCFEISAIDVE